MVFLEEKNRAGFCAVHCDRFGADYFGDHALGKMKSLRSRSIRILLRDFEQEKVKSYVIDGGILTIDLKASEDL